MLDDTRIRSDFPILSREVNGHPLVYLDSAATSQKPNSVIDAVGEYYRTSNANVHRGVHTLGDEATRAYDFARARVAQFLNGRASEIVFVRNATEALNLVAQTWAAANLQEGDEIVVSSYEHHSNILPWQRISRRRGAKVRFLPMDAEQGIALESLNIIGPRTKLVAVGHVSNAFGTVAPVAEIVAAAHANGAKVLLDGAQSVPHQPVNVQQLGVDFLAFSGHKMCGPMGIGVLWAKEDILESMQPFLVGGGMVEAVSFDDTEFAADVTRFEAGTPNVADAVGLAAAIDYLDSVGMDAVHAHERDLVTYGLNLLGGVPGLRLFGPSNPSKHGAVLSFGLEGFELDDIGTFLDQSGIAIRAGKHCCHPAMAALGVPGTARASVYLYNNRTDLDRLAEELDHLRQVGPHAVKHSSAYCP